MFEFVAENFSSRVCGHSLATWISGGEGERIPREGGLAFRYKETITAYLEDVLEASEQCPILEQQFKVNL